MFSDVLGAEGASWISTGDNWAHCVLHTEGHTYAPHSHVVVVMATGILGDTPICLVFRANS